MNNRINEIDSYLTFLRNVYMQNPSLSITPRSIYGSLSGYGIDDRSDLSLKDYHSEWVQYFDNIDNIDVFVSPSWQYFCQFKNMKNPLEEKNRLKLYLSVDKLHIDQAAKDIFKFLADNDIEHISKIGSKVRSDSIVIRLQNIEDLSLVKEFVKNCDSVNKGKLKTNPFLYRDEVFAYALDDYLSYNNVVSTYLSEYFNLKRNENTLDSVCYSDFYKFLYEKYCSVFIQGKDIDKYMKEYNYNFGHHPKGFPALFLNYYQITYLLLTSLNPNFSLEQIVDFYHEYNDENKLSNQLSQAEDLLYDKNKQKEPTAYVVKQANLYTDEYIVKKCVAVMSKKYGINQTRINFSNYINKNDSGYITRESGMRGFFNKSLSPDKVLSVLSKLISNNDFEDFAKCVSWEFDDKEILKNAAFVTLKKYQELNKTGVSQLYHALNLGMSGDYSGFTNQDLARAKLGDNVLPADFKKTIISSLNLDENEEYNSAYLINRYANYISTCYNYAMSMMGGNSI